MQDKESTIRLEFLKGLTLGGLKPCMLDKGEMNDIYKHTSLL
jgi:hypothetical protein